MPFYFFSFVQKYTTTCVRRSKVKPTCEFLWTLIWDDLKCATTHLSITEIKYLPLMTYSSSLFLPSHSYFLFFVFFRLPQNQRHDTKDNSHAIPWMFKLIYIFEHPRYAIAVKAALAALKSLQAVVRLLLTPCKNRNGF